MASPAAGPSAEGWREPAGWLTRARRLGPLRYSDLGPRRLSTLADGDLEPLAAWITAATERWWAEAGRPDPYTLVVVSGDDGHLAREVLAKAAPACAAALRYVLVDPDRVGVPADPPAELARLVPLEEPAYLYPTAPHDPADDDLDTDERPPACRIGPLATYLTEVPALGEAPGAVVALGVLSRLPYELYERAGDEWWEVRLAAVEERLEEIAVPGVSRPPAAPEAPAPAAPASDPAAPALGGPAPTPARWRRLTGAADWLRRELTASDTGVLAVIDRWEGPGDTDSVDLDQLRHVREPLDSAPQPLAGTGLSVVRWRLG